MTLDRIILDQLFADIQEPPFVRYFSQFLIRRREANEWELENIDITNLNHWGGCRYTKIVVYGNLLILARTASAAKLARDEAREVFDLHDPEVFGKILWRAHATLTGIIYNGQD